MAQALVLTVMLLYFIAGLDFIRQGQFGMAITFIAYAVANVGLWMASNNL